VNFTDNLLCVSTSCCIFTKTQDHSRASLYCLKLRMTYSIFAAVLLGAAWALANVEAHLDISIIACHTNGTDPEDEEQVDGDEMFYVDIKNKELHFTLPEFADKFTSPGWAEQAQANYQNCISNVKVAAQGEKYPPEEIEPPQSTIHSMEEVELGKSNTLICFVNNFHPPPVQVKWTKNDVEVKDGVTLSRYYPNTDSTFQQFSTLSIIPEEGDVYSCSVEHKGLHGPLTRIWEPEANNESHMAATVFCGIGLTLGLLGVGVGTFFLIKGNNCN
ncbi:hypothetical protein SKAU_G00427390, partial [Synaphobranchus kaupii]